MFIVKEIQTAAYLFACILFILSLSGLSSQDSAKRGVIYGLVGMIIAIVATSEVRPKCTFSFFFYKIKKIIKTNFKFNKPTIKRGRNFRLWRVS